MNTNPLPHVGLQQPGTSSESWSRFLPPIRYVTIPAYILISICVIGGGAPAIRIRSQAGETPAVVLTLFGSRLAVASEPPRFCFVADGEFRPQRWLTAADLNGKGGAK